MFRLTGLRAGVTDPTITYGDILDLLLTTKPDKVGIVGVLPSLASSSHSPVVIEYVFMGELGDGGAAAGVRWL